MFSISRFLWILAACFSIYVQSATQSPNVLLIRGGEAVKSTPVAVPDVVPSGTIRYHSFLIVLFFCPCLK